ncbi:MAG: hypothetical protein MUC58_02110 [Rhizobiaceae bacterium]|jgi:hypothetical protein|nr:hypothetical protein [Rhizobiaceae bacterium]
MRPVRTVQQELQTLAYLGDMLEQMGAMAAADNHRLLSYILHTACLEVDALRQTRQHMTLSGDKKHDAA